MFGNVTSSWANPQANQQQTPGSTFGGQPSGAFGATNTTNAFGSTSAFGQPQQSQQPAANPMFGNVGTPAAQTGTTGAFGGFGNTANTSTGAFGAKPTGGFGAFGGTPAPSTSAFGGTTGAFGQPANTGTTGTGLFGQNASTTGTTSAFGGGGGLFGQSKPSAFGTTPGTTQHPVITTGTANPPYSPHHEKDGNATAQYQAIVCMPAYAGYSFEELRVQDYAQGRKTAGTTGAFGQTPAFGAAPASTQPSTGLFGATQPAQTNSVFGATPAAAPATTGFGGFGGNAAAPAQPAGGGLFGGGGAFGTNTQQQPAQTGAFGGGAFGAQTQQQPQQSTGLFGATNTTNAFGSTAPKPAFGGFGTTPAAGATPSAFGGTGAFGGQTTQQPASQPATGLFGAAQPAATSNAFGATANKGLFGANTTTPTAPAAGAFGGFGQTQQPAQQQNQQQGTGLFGGGLFGQQNQQQPAQQPAGTGLFGSNTATQQPAGGGLFGGGGGLFGNNQQNQQQNQQQANPLFGGNKPAAPAGGGLFGGFGQQQNNAAATGQTGTGLFGNNLGQNTNQQSGGFGGLFGAKPAAPNIGTSSSTGQGGLFGQPMGASTNPFGASAAPQQGSLTASINQPIGSNLPIFNMLPPGPRLVDLDQTQPKKKSPFFVDVPSRNPIPRGAQQSFAPASSKLRGFGASTNLASSQVGNPFAGSTSILTGKAGALSLTDSRRGSVVPDSILGRSGSPALGSGSRQSVKKVILDKKIEPSQLFVKSGSPGPGGKVVFSPALSVAARESEAAAAKAAANPETPTPAPRAPQKSPGRFTATSKNSDRGGPESEEGTYWVKPDVEALAKLGYDELTAFKGLVVGRVGYGQIEFLEPVDLTGLPRLGMLKGEVIEFEEKECSVYPDGDADKPPPGSGLNVKARMTLERCWPEDKATREPIKDPNHPTVLKHLKRLKNIKGTKFESFDMETGKWTFTVDHF
ncbi:nucleoporin autopeptidase-domain-containing protein [Ephemerocybe angulata]|uniref:Nucleoporin autopeptidase-domain-containing protein n=1 Tax=Ephemerocybe angulata TaxID=980116 RepID=A0A8H6ID55_9AGAR|nr:nucleoporin autopeptidase-domain-containing protein [Tulosesus angulatus]